jgi:hypothetical protein
MKRAYVTKASASAAANVTKPAAVNVLINKAKIS